MVYVNTWKHVSIYTIYTYPLDVQESVYINVEATTPSSMSVSSGDTGHCLHGSQGPFRLW